MRKFLVALVLAAPAAAAAQSYYATAAVDPNADPKAPAWSEPAPYAREGQVDEGTANDAAHRADRAYTAYLNKTSARMEPARRTLAQGCGSIHP